jgi:hypothetical protein
MHNLEKLPNRRKPVLFFKEPKGSFFGREVVIMIECAPEIRDGKLRVPGQEEVEVEIIDNGEDFIGEKGSIPNHDKVEIVNISPKS